VQQTRQPVVVGEVPQPCLVLAPLRDVLHLPQDVQRRAGRVADQGGLRGDPNHAAVGGDEPVLVARVVLRQATNGRGDQGAVVGVRQPVAPSASSCSAS